MKKIAFLLLAFMLVSCKQNNIKTQDANDPVKNFDFVWNTLDVNYALFNAKDIDWKQIYLLYRTQVTAKTTEKELFSLITKMLEPLNDNHVMLETERPHKVYSSGLLGEFMISHVNVNKYIGNQPSANSYFLNGLKTAFNKTYKYGWLTDDIAYLYISNFDNDSLTSAKALEDILSEFKDSKALVIDIRRNLGGNGSTCQAIANRFADRKRLFMTTEYRCGGNYDEFEPKNYWFVEPAGKERYTKNVVLLTDKLTLSAAENFTLAMRILPQVSVVGDLTSGCFANSISTKLPNGWILRVSNSQTLDYDGICREGLGIMPDYKLHANYFEFQSNPDPLLDFAILSIRTNSFVYHKHENSLKRTESLVKTLESNIEKEGLTSAIDNFNKLRTNNNDEKYYLSFNEIIGLGNKLISSNKKTEGEAILKLATELFPDASNGYKLLGIAYYRNNKTDEALIEFNKAIETNKKKSENHLVPINEYFNNVLVYSLIMKGYDDMTLKFREFISKFPDRINENLLNGLGYELISYQMYKEAIQVFKLNAESFSESANVWDSLGEAYVLSGNKELAIESYEKALKLNSHLSSSINALKKLKSQL